MSLVRIGATKVFSTTSPVNSNVHPGLGAAGLHHSTSLTSRGKKERRDDDPIFSVEEIKVQGS
jgi:hypothetical protein